MTADKVLSIARGELGVKESPAGSNNVKYNTWYYGREVSGNYPWCMAFVQWVMARAGVEVPVRTASCRTLMTHAKRLGQWVTEGYKPGDVVIYDFPGGAATDHTGIVERVYEDGVVAIEGNTSVSNASNGGEVRRMMRDVSLVVGAWRPEYETEDEDMDQEKFNQMMDHYLAERGALPDAGWGAEWEQAKEWAEAEGIIKGDGDGNRMYQAFTTRQQMVMFLYRLGKKLGL